MRTMKSVFGLVAAAIPVLYCGGLLIYFSGVEERTGLPVGDALNPTMLGLGAIGLLFLIPLVLKILKLFGGRAAPGAGGGRADRPPKEEQSDFDPDAALARYMARRASGAEGEARPARPAAFGRKGA